MRHWLRSRLGLQAAAQESPQAPTISWVNEVLKGGGADPFDGTEGPLLDQFLPFPNSARPRLLIPRGFSRGASRSVLEFTDATSLRVRLERAALSMAIRTGALEKIYGRSDPRRGEEPLPPGRLALEDHIREVFGSQTARFAVSMGPPRANIKPVLRVLDDKSRTLGYVKIGWNSLTKDLITHEADVLEKMQHQTLKSLRVPALIHSGVWSDLELLAVSTAPDARWLGGLPSKALPIAATCEVAGLGPSSVEPLETSSYWTRLRKRASDQRAASSSSQAQTVLPAVIEYVERRYGHRTLSFGTWHGDWVPWNMRRLGDVVYVWDWERSDRCVPLGLDAMHFEFQVNLWLRRKRPVKALVDAIARSSETLQRIVPEKGLEHLLATLVCIEMSIRMEQGAMASVPIPGRTYFALEEVFSVLRS